MNWVMPNDSKPLAAFLCAVTLLVGCKKLTAIEPVQTGTSQSGGKSQSAEAWREDLRHLAKELPTRHVKAYHSVSRETFASEVEKLDAAISRMNDDEVRVGFMRIVALIGDGHTHLDLPRNVLRYPVELHWFGDELRVVAATNPYHSAVGARVVAIGSTPIKEVMKRATPLVPNGENAGRTRLTATMQLTIPDVLHGLGLIADRGKAPFELELANGVRSTVTLSPAPLGDPASWRMATGEKPPLALQRLTEPWWTQTLTETQTIYFSFTRYPSAAEFRRNTEALARQLDESRAKRLVIDLRRNGGGDFERFRQILLPVIKSRSAICRKGGLFVITGPGTFSAAVVNAIDLRTEAHAILVGAPTGMRPSHYGEPRQFRLPNCGLQVSYSTHYHRFGLETDSAVIPDQPIEPTWAEFCTGRDPVMEWILSRKD